MLGKADKIGTVRPQRVPIERADGVARARMRRAVQKESRMSRRPWWLRSLGGVVCATGLVGTGCQSTCPTAESLAPDVPRELHKVAHPPYVIEQPDILLIDALRVIPLPPYKVEPLDDLIVRVTPPFAGNVIDGMVTVDPDGTINLGPTFGSVRIVDLTLEQTKLALAQRLRTVYAQPKDEVITVALARSRGLQQIRGQHLVRPDGTVSLGLYGSVYVAGHTLQEAKLAIENHLSAYLYRPEVAVDVFAYNSKVYYIVTDGGGNGEQVFRIPATGNETVLDAISQINGLPAVAAKNRIWVARPAPAGHSSDQILPVDWKGVVMGGRTATNYQVLPGDRVYVMSQPIITADTHLGRALAPLERILGITLLGNSTVRGVNGAGAGAGQQP
jgi:polysaccharide export outer membrane protein